MATIDLATYDGTGVPSGWAGGVEGVRVLVKEIDLAAAATAKGSALAVSDVIEAVNVGAGSVAVFGGVKVIEEMTGTSIDATIDIGVTGGDVDNFVDGFDLDGASADDIAVGGVNEPVAFTAADTVDVLIATQTGTITGGKILVFVAVANIGKSPVGGLAALGS